MGKSVDFTPHPRGLSGIIILLSLGVITYATLTPEAGSPDFAPLCIICGSRGGVDTILNILLFLPFGIGLAIAAVGRNRAVLTVVILSTLIETLQFIGVPGRNPSAGDILTNTLGGALGFAIGRYARVWLRPSARTAKTLALAGALIWLATQAVSSFAFTPSLPTSTYYGQLGRSFARMETFPGEILAATIGPEPVSDSAFPDSRRVQALLRNGATVAATIIPAGTTRGTAPIVRIADTHRQEIVLLAQRRDKLVFGVRSGAASLRLRSPLYALAGVLPASGSAQRKADTLRISGHVGSGIVELRAEGYGVSHQRRISVPTSFGWVLVLPFQWRIEGTSGESLVARLWVFLLFLPYSYWNASSVTRMRTRTRGRWSLFLAMSILLIGAGLAAVPRLAGESAPSPPGDWLAALAASAVGFAAAYAANRDQKVE